MKIKQKLILSFSTIIAATLVLSAIYSMVLISKISIENIYTTTEKSVEIYGEKLESWLSEKKAIVEATAITLSTQGKIDINMLKSHKIRPGEFNDLYVGFEDGTFVDGIGWIPDSGFDARTRGWYTKAKLENKFVFSSAYVDADTKEYVISPAVPLVVNGNLAGVLAADIKLTTLVKIVGNVDLFGGKGRGMLIDENGLVLAHYKEEYVS